MNVLSEIFAHADVICQYASEQWWKEHAIDCAKSLKQALEIVEGVAEALEHNPADCKCRACSFMREAKRDEIQD